MALGILLFMLQSLSLKNVSKWNIRRHLLNKFKLAFLISYFFCVKKERNRVGLVFYLVLKTKTITHQRGTKWDDSVPIGFQPK